MHELRARVPESTVNALARRTVRLSELIERATQVSPHKGIRDGGAQLVELLGERMEEIRELHSMDDEDLPERIRTFSLRLKLAEEKVTSWPQAKPPRRSTKVEAKNGRRSPRRPAKHVKSAA